VGLAADDLPRRKSELYVGVVRKEELAGLLAALSTVAVDPRVVLPAAPAYASLLGQGILAAEPAPTPETPAPVTAILDVGTSGPASAWSPPAPARPPAPSRSGPRRWSARSHATSPSPNRTPRRSSPPSWTGRRPRSRSPRSRPSRAPPRHCAARSPPGPRAARVAARLEGPRPARPVGGLLLAGELGRLPGLPELLGPEIEGPISTLALTGPAMERIPPREVPAFALALSLALRGQQGGRAPRLNLRRGDLAYTRDFEHLKGRLVRLGVQVSLVVLLAIVGAGVQAWALSRQENALDKALCDAENKILGKCIDNYEIAVQTLRGRGTPTSSIRRSPPWRCWRSSPRSCGRGADAVRPRRDHEGQAPPPGDHRRGRDVDKLVTALRTSRCFGDARSGGARRRGTEGKFEFSADASLTCVEGAVEAGRKP